MDCDEFSGALGGVTGRFVSTARSTKEWWMQAVVTGRVLTQILQIGGAVAFAGHGKRGEISLHIPLTNSTRIRVDGQLLERDSFLLVTDGLSFMLGTSEPTQWLGIVVRCDDDLLPPEFMQSLQPQLLSKSTAPHIRTEAEHLNRIKYLTSQAFTAADNLPLAAGALRHTDDEIIVALARALQASSRARRQRVGRPSLSRRRTIASALALADASAGAPLFTRDLCRATGVSERTLRNVFHEYFGVGPMRLLRVRQLHEIRAALLAADPKHETVYGIAARFGICDLSLFARNYKALFGASPSHTLSTLSPRTHRDLTFGDWLHYASRALSNQLATEGSTHVAIPSHAPVDG